MRRSIRLRSPVRLSALALLTAMLVWIPPAAREGTQAAPRDWAEVIVFAALPQREAVLLRWETSRDFQVAMYRCRRSQAVHGPDEVVYEVAALGAVGRAAYEAVDHPPVAGVYFYTLEEVTVVGRSEFTAPVRAFVGSNWTNLPAVLR